MQVEESPYQLAVDAQQEAFEALRALPVHSQVLLICGFLASYNSPQLGELLQSQVACLLATSCECVPTSTVAKCVTHQIL